MKQVPIIGVLLLISNIALAQLRVDKVAPLQPHNLAIPKIAKASKWASVPLCFAAGLTGGMGEGYLSHDGNWDTRSKRSHNARDASIYLTALAGGTFTTGFVLDLTNDRINPKEFFAFLLSNILFYHIGTRIGYNATK